MEEVRQILNLLAGTLENHNLVSDEGLAVLEVVNRYARTWQLLLQYDENNLPAPETKHVTKSSLEIDKARQAIAALKNGLKKTEGLQQPGLSSQGKIKNGHYFNYYPCKLLGWSL